MRRTILLAALGGAATFATPAQAQQSTCIGNCGTTSTVFSGSVGPAPTNFGEYDWVSTNGGVNGAARIPGFADGATNGSELISAPFFGSVGQSISFFFNYITSDGSGFADYAFAQLLGVPVNQPATTVANLFTARTKPTGVIVPGTDLPGVEATLVPANVFIQPGTVWAPLGPSSGACFGPGCGNTGWVQSTYTLTQAGTYQLRFGAANFSDTALDSGLAFSGLLLDGNTIGDGSSFDNPLLPGTIGPNGEFQFTFTVDPFEVIFVDPLVATGYDFVVGAGGPGILSAVFPELGDSNGYEIYLLSDLTTAIATGIMGGVTVNFATLTGGAVSGFGIRGIDAALGLDPTDTTAFVTGLTFQVSGSTTIQLTQTPITIDVPDATAAVPEPTTWAMLLIGFGAIGGALRRRRRPAEAMATA